MNTPAKPDKRSQQNDLAPHVQAMIQDMREIIQKVDEFQFQIRLAWKRNQTKFDEGDQ